MCVGWVASPCLGAEDSALLSDDAGDAVGGLARDGGGVPAQTLGPVVQTLQLLAGKIEAVELGVNGELCYGVLISRVDMMWC